MDYRADLPMFDEMIHRHHHRRTRRPRRAYVALATALTFALAIPAAHAQTPKAPAATGGTSAPVKAAPADPVISEAARRLNTGRDVLAVLGERLTKHRVIEDKAKASYEVALEVVDLRRRARQVLLEHIAVAGNDLVGARKLQLRHGTAMVDLLQGGLLAVAGGADLLVLDPADATRQQYHGELYEAAAKHLRNLLRQDAAAIKTIETDIAATRKRVPPAEGAIAAAEQEAQTIKETYEAAVKVREGTEGLIREVSSARAFPDLDIGLIVLDSYLRATRRVDAADPECGVEWWALAAVGFVESNHGEGRRILADGTVLDLIVGPVLDGTGDVAEIKDTDGGLLDGDTEHDRAVGPMQFIPETWKILGADGNNDGVRDPSNVYDAALAAARLLCASRRG